MRGVGHLFCYTVRSNQLQTLPRTGHPDGQGADRGPLPRPLPDGEGSAGARGGADAQHTGGAAAGGLPGPGEHARGSGTDHAGSSKTNGGGEA